MVHCWRKREKSKSRNHSQSRIWEYIVCVHVCVSLSKKDCTSLFLCIVIENETNEKENRKEMITLVEAVSDCHLGCLSVGRLSGAGRQAWESSLAYQPHFLGGLDMKGGIVTNTPEKFKAIRKIFPSF